jgi:hypothetical protein
MTAASLRAALDRIGHVQHHLPPAVAVLVGIVAASAVLPGLWLITRHVAVIAHEAAHATLGSAVGGSVRSIRLLRDASGVTAVSGHGTAGSVVTGLAGYLGPSLFGVGAAVVIRLGHIVAVLWLALLVLALVLLVLRSLFGCLTVILSSVLLFGVAGFAPVGVQVLASYGITWFLLASGIRMILEHGKANADGRALHSATKIPAGFWFRLWHAGTIVAVLFGAMLLV